MIKSFIVASLLLIVLSCNSTKPGTNQIIDEHNSQNALDWEGIYRGILPCADCEGIQTTVYLNKDLSYNIKSRYMGKSDSVFQSSGHFIWNKEGSQISLKSNTNEETLQYQVGENVLIQLDQQGEKITGVLADHYMLSKSAFALYERYWKLVAVNGKPVVADSSFRKEPHLIFKEADNRVTGNDGCNSFSGSFGLEGRNQIGISQLASTLMACPNMDIPQQFVEVLQKADRYQIDGDNLSLSQEKGTWVARFQSVVMH